MIKPISVAQYDARLTGDQEVAGRQHSFVEIDHEIFSTVILSITLIQDGQLTVSGESHYADSKRAIICFWRQICTLLDNRLED